MTIENVIICLLVILCYLSYRVGYQIGEQDGKIKRLVIWISVNGKDKEELEI